jgi:hypothetical protein
MILAIIIPSSNSGDLYQSVTTVKVKGRIGSLTIYFANPKSPIFKIPLSFINKFAPYIRNLIRFY